MDLWAQVAPILGLSFVPVSEESMVGYNFWAFRREIAEPIDARGKPDRWLVGERGGGTQVLVRTGRLNPFHETERYLDINDHPRTREVFRPYVLCLAEIDPPSFAGMVVEPRGYDRFRDAEIPLALSGHPALDAAYEIQAQDPARLRAVFARSTAAAAASAAGAGGPDPDLGDYLARMAPATRVLMTDGLVEVILPGEIPEPRAVSQALDVAVYVARALSARNRGLPENPGDAHWRTLWRDLAASRGLAFEPARWRIHGAIRGVLIEVTLEPASNGIFTHVRAQFRRHLGCGLRVVRDDPSPPGTIVTLDLKKLFGTDDAKLGYPDFDPHFNVKAFSIPHARALFAYPTTRNLVCAIAQWNAGFQVNDREISLVNRGFGQPEALIVHIDRLVALVDALTP